MRKISDEEIYKFLAEMNKGGGGDSSVAYQAPSTVSSDSGTITSRELELSDSGGGGGMDMMSQFSNLGDMIQKNALSTLSMFKDWESEALDRHRQARQDKEAVRQFDKNYALSSRGQNLNSMNFLANARANSQGIANRRIPFREALAKAM
ncbi:MAG: hypothetical protein JXB48_21165 [Candidatus Latescibacteria bacterium]|nr:hypothetical protein [Candidatus Latescibacterota bacterium]